MPARCESDFRGRSCATGFAGAFATDLALAFALTRDFLPAVRLAGLRLFRVFFGAMDIFGLIGGGTLMNALTSGKRWTRRRRVGT